MKVSFTIDFRDEKEHHDFETWLQSYFEQQIRVNVLPDTAELYKTDAKFKALVKDIEKAKALKQDYLIKLKAKNYESLHNNT
jgi:hypothetical protein